MKLSETQRSDVEKLRNLRSWFQSTKAQKKKFLQPDGTLATGRVSVRGNLERENHCVCHPGVAYGTVYFQVLLFFIFKISK